MIDESLIAFLAEIRALSTDESGRQILVGLTFSETAEYFSDQIDSERYCELDDRHQAVRLQIIAAENELRVSKPIRN